MTKKEFGEVCSLQNSGASIMVSYLDFKLTGKLVGCWEDDLLLNVNGQHELWPRELCQAEKKTYPIPSYS